MARDKTAARSLEKTENRDAFMLIAPLLLLLAVFIVYPVFANFYYAFTRWKGFGNPRWVGFDNFVRVFGDDRFWISIKNLAILTLYIPLGIFIPLILSAILREGFRGWVFFKAILYLPNVLGMIILGLLFSIVLRDSGALNSLLRSIGWEDPVNWIGSSKPAIHMIGVIHVVWSKIGFGIIYFLAAMSSISSDMYDAARIDGAGWWRTFFSVTVPGISFAIEFFTVLSFITVFARMFGFIFTFTGGGPGYSTFTLEFGIYRLGFSGFRMGYGSSWSVILFFFVAIIAIAQIRLMRRASR